MLTHPLGLVNESGIYLTTGTSWICEKDKWSLRSIEARSLIPSRLSSPFPFISNIFSFKQVHVTNSIKIFTCFVPVSTLLVFCTYSKHAEAGARDCTHSQTNCLLWWRSTWFSNKKQLDLLEELSLNWITNCYIGRSYSIHLFPIGPTFSPSLSSLC